MENRTNKTFIAVLLITGLAENLFAYSDADLIAIRSAFDNRRNSVLAAQIADPYPGTSNTAEYVWNRQDFALSALYMNTQLMEASQAIIDACNAYKADLDSLDENFHFRGPLFFRLYKYFGHDSEYPEFRGRLTSEAEYAICDILWLWAKSRSKVSEAEIPLSRTWIMWGSENHDAQRDASCYSAAAILKDVAGFNTLTYNDGKTALQHYNAWNAFLKEYLRERAKKGLFLEIGSHTYARYTLQGIYNLYDFAEDIELRKLSGMLLDLWWADWAHDQINGVRGGGKCRVYQDSDRFANNDGSYAACWFYLNIGYPCSKHPGWMCLATSTYRMPLVVMDLALDISGRGIYESKSRRQGLSVLPRPILPPDFFQADPNYGGLYRYTYVTPSFVIGSLMMESRPESDWLGVSSQNRWQGVIFSSHADARIIPQCAPVNNDPRTYNQYWSVQNKGTLITQRLNTCVNTGVMRIYFSKKVFNQLVEESGWVFVQAGDSYAAVRPIIGAYSWDITDSNFMRLGSGGLSNGTTPIIFEVAQSKDYADFAAFRTAVKALPLSYSSGILTYQGLCDNGTFTLYANYSQLPKVNGVPINLTPDYTFDSPFMHEDWASGNVKIRKSGRTCLLDFNSAVKTEYFCGEWGYMPGDITKDCSNDINDLNIIIDNWLGFDSWLGDVNALPLYNDDPLTDSSLTKALWHMDSTYTGADNVVRVADDDSVGQNRNHELWLGSSRSGYSLATRPTLTAGGYDGNGSCLFYDGSSDESISAGAWTAGDSLLLDVWIKPAGGSGIDVVAEAAYVWSLRIVDNVLNFLTWHSDDSLHTYAWPGAMTLNEWHHVRAVLTAEGKKQVTIDGVTNTSIESGLPLKILTKDITVGKSTSSMYYSGYMDELRIASVNPEGYRSGIVNFNDMAVIVEHWLACTDPALAECVHGL